MQNLPARSGIGLKAQHYQDIIEHQPDVGGFEIHAENYMGNGGSPHAYLNKICETYPLSIHGVGLSLGSANGINTEHLERFKTLVQRYQPAQISEHLSWSQHDDIFLNDLLPLPYTKEALHIFQKNIDHVQSILNQKILIENPSAYIGFNNNTLEEPDFLNQLCEKTGCGLLLDINNVYVSAHNQKFSAHDYLLAIDDKHVKEIHLAGHATQTLSNNNTLKIDDHGSAICDDVWQLYDIFIKQTEKTYPTLIEWDTNIPDIKILLAEAQQAEKRMHKLLTEF